MPSDDLETASNGHITEERYCWCNPTWLAICFVCGGTGCENCNDGFVETDDEDLIALVLHHAD